MNQSHLDVFSIQIVANYLKLKSDFLNIIQVKKQFRYVLDRFRINPIPITRETKNLFQCLDTQQIFWNQSLTQDPNWELGDIELIFSNIKIIQFNCEVTYSQYSELMEKKNKNKLKFEMKFKQLIYTAEDRKKYGDKIPDGINVIGFSCFKHSKRPHGLF